MRDRDAGLFACGGRGGTRDAFPHRTDGRKGEVDSSAYGLSPVLEFGRGPIFLTIARWTAGADHLRWRATGFDLIHHYY